MDTRVKIVQRTALPSPDTRIGLAKGWFDVLTAEHCALLSAAKPSDGSLVVLVYRETPQRPAPLCAYDRAQMVAALGSVDWVCLCEAGESAVIAEALGAESVTDIDAVQKRDVVRDVLQGQAQA